MSSSGSSIGSSEIRKRRVSRPQGFVDEKDSWGPLSDHCTKWISSNLLQLNISRSSLMLLHRGRVCDASGNLLYRMTYKHAAKLQELVPENIANKNKRTYGTVSGRAWQQAQESSETNKRRGNAL
ncbi:hypothetical protein M0804_011621 [Polistes exclamans]|nr:hypothetical protein M0804_011621 [Polistes exclamans]